MSNQKQWLFLWWSYFVNGVNHLDSKSHMLNAFVFILPLTFSYVHHSGELFPDELMVVSLKVGSMDYALCHAQE